MIFACNKSEKKLVQVENPFFIKAVDASFIPEIRLSNLITKNANGEAEDMLLTLKNAGVNTIRLRIWNDPMNQHSGLEEVKNFSDEIKKIGLKVWLTIHYSDTWADPGAQTKPSAWNGLTFLQLKDSMKNYTSKIAKEIKPDPLSEVVNIEEKYREIIELKRVLLDKLRAKPSKIIQRALKQCNHSIKKLIKHARSKNSNTYEELIDQADTQVFVDEIGYFKNKLSNKEQLRIMADLREINGYMYVKSHTVYLFFNTGLPSMQPFNFIFKVFNLHR